MVGAAPEATMTENRWLAAALAATSAAAAWSLVRSEAPIATGAPLTEIRDPTRLRYESATTTVTATRRSDEWGPYWWVEVEQGDRRLRFVANEDGEEALAELAPLRSKRNLALRLDDRRAEVGLEPPQGTLQLEGPRGTDQIAIGGQTQAGRGDYYVQRLDGRDVHLVEARPLSDLIRRHRRLRLRTFRPTPRAEVARAVISTGDRTVTAIQQNRDDAAFWALAAAPNEPHAETDALLDLVESMTFADYADVEPAELVPVAKVQWKDDDDESLGELEVARSAGTPRYVARSGWTRGWTALTDAAGEEFEARLSELAPP
jgi:hypothetical protein